MPNAGSLTLEKGTQSAVILEHYASDILREGLETTLLNRCIIVEDRRVRFSPIGTKIGVA